METRTQRVSPTRRVTAMAMLAATAYVLMWACRPIPEVSGFLRFEVKDVPIIISGFIFGPLAPVGVSAVASLLEMITISDTGLVGLVMNMLSSCSAACVAAMVYRRWQSMKGALAGLAAGVLVMAAVMMLWNWLLTPVFMKVPRAQVVGMLIPVFLPFNLLKGGTNAGLAMLLYKPLVLGLRRVGLVPPRAAAQGSGGAGPRLNLGVVLAALFVAASCIMVVFIWVGVL